MSRGHRERERRIKMVGRNQYFSQLNIDESLAEEGVSRFSRVCPGFPLARNFPLFHDQIDTYVLYKMSTNMTRCDMSRCEKRQGIRATTCNIRSRHEPSDNGR